MLLGTLCDDTHGVTRVSEVARITHYAGRPTVREPENIARWEWHTPADLRHLPQPLFTPTAQALNVVWPGLLPGLPAAHLTPRPPAPGPRPRDVCGSPRRPPPYGCAAGWSRT
ncbi:hypothetical protein [Streptomyces sp. ISL-86]|uniref:hypothetical protein n=1 Tax=Streptomyces sp. ISL-86 TaxID=2819187 RepID=UPI001BEA1389|nr:hypothetical protein [Streptomyces sp. ISL-86]MBT2459831.1 hypothetical protein [Streptomyces sp. ISL-86]